LGVTVDHDGEIYLLRDGRRMVSMASLTRKVKDGQVISFIYTPPEDRGRGYAAELTASLSRYCLEKGSKFCCLFTQMNNPTSNKIYQKVGYRWVDEFLRIGFEGQRTEFQTSKKGKNRFLLLIDQAPDSLQP
jgi:predicted GNAT family acetyltransferase